MTVPTPTFTSDDLSTGWTESGSPTYSDDLWGGQAFVGDGIDNRLTYASALISAAQTNFSVSSWIKSTDTTTNVLIAQHDGSNLDFEIYLKSSGAIEATADNGDNLYRTTSKSTAIYADGNWHHVVVTFAPSSVQIYVDGSEVSYSSENTSGSSGHFVDVQGTPIVTTIGEWETSTANRYFVGDLARPRLWDGDTLTSGEALEEYNAEVAAIAETTWTKSYDDMNHADWTVNGSATFETDIHGGSALIGDAVDNSVQQSQIITTADGGENTISFWFKTTDGTNQQCWYAQGGIGVGSGRIEIYTASSNAIVARFVTEQTPTDRSWVDATVTNYHDGNWHHLLVTVKGGTSNSIKMYFDGADVGTDSYLGGGYTGLGASWTADTTVGSDIDPKSFLRTSSRLTRLKVLSTGFFDPLQVTKEYDAEVAAIITTDYLNLNTSFTLTGGGSESDSLWNPLDTSVLDGVNDYWDISASQLMPTGTQFTFNLWFNCDATGNYIFSERDVGATNGMFMWLATDVGTVKCRIHTDGSNRTDLETSGTDYRDGEWHHVSLSVDGNTQTLKIDDVVVDNTPSITGSGFSGGGITDTTRGYQGLGQNGASGGYLDGSLARLKIVNYPMDTAWQTVEYNAEVAAQGEGFGGGESAIISPLVSPLIEPAIGGIFS